MLQLDKTSKKPYYVQIYEYFRGEIESRRLPAGEKMASVRELAQSVDISKMTVEKAYYQLASEGYIMRRNKARYEVVSLGEYNGRPANWQPQYTTAVRKPTYRYDFGSGDMDMEQFPLDIWRKHMNRALSNPEKLLACNDDQGVWELRQALSQYVYQTRGVHTNPENIVIGAGTPALLSILVNLLSDTYTTIGVENPGFRLGREIFRHSGFSIHPFFVRQGIIDMKALEKSDVRLVYVSPSHQFPTGTVMPAGMRHQLLQWAKKHDGMIIEDDYDSELR
jgi:GntR family transcriptional regulator/MocR family aminotransferase